MYDYGDMTIPQEIKSEIYLGKGVYFFDIAIIFGYWFILSNFEALIYPPLQVIYTIFNIIVGFILTRKSPAHPQKRIYEAVIFYAISLRVPKLKYHTKERKKHEEVVLINQE